VGLGERQTVRRKTASRLRADWCWSSRQSCPASGGMGKVKSCGVGAGWAPRTPHHRDKGEGTVRETAPSRFLSGSNCQADIEPPTPLSFVTAPPPRRTAVVDLLDGVVVVGPGRGGCEHGGQVEGHRRPPVLRRRRRHPGTTAGPAEG